MRPREICLEVAMVHTPRSVFILLMIIKRQSVLNGNILLIA